MFVFFTITSTDTSFRIRLWTGIKKWKRVSYGINNVFRMNWAQVRLTPADSNVSENFRARHLTSLLMALVNLSIHNSHKTANKKIGLITSYGNDWGTHLTSILACWLAGFSSSCPCKINSATLCSCSILRAVTSARLPTDDRYIFYKHTHLNKHLYTEY